jgi:hypothetical protein
MTGDAYYYEITQVDDTNLTLTLKKRTITFSDGSTKTIVY